MNVWLKLALGTLSLAQFQTVQAQNRVLSTIATRAAYKVEGGPLVSVIIPAYNEESYLPALLASLPNQTYSNIESVVVDNLSEDRTAEIARNMGARVVTSEEYNLSRSRNLGASEAQGEILVFIDADTVPESRLIEECVQEILNGASYVIPNKVCTDSYLWSLGRVLWNTLVPSPSTTFLAVSREAYDAVGGFDEECLPQEACSEDLDFARRLSEVGRMAYLRFTYAGTSARRQKAQGLIPVGPHWDQRAYRRQIV